MNSMVSYQRFIACAVLLKGVCLVLLVRGQTSENNAAASGKVNIPTPQEPEGSWTVDLLMPTHSCGGSLIASSYILTLASCVTQPGLEPKHILVLLGIYDETSAEPEMEVMTAEEIIIHENFNIDQPSVDNVALIKLSDVAKFRDKDIVPIAIADDDAYRNIRQRSRRCFVFGKGVALKNIDEFTQSTGVRKIRTRYIKCKGSNSFSVPPFTRTDFECVKTVTRGEAVCFEDQGQPMVCRYQGVWYQTGMYAAYNGLYGCKAGFAGVNNIDTYRKWILSNI